ncbi:aminopeptidase, partial [Corallococcus exiguus]|nr:aminopeptidase [Corallococcus exiguus]
MRTFPGWWLLCALAAGPVVAATPPAPAAPAIPGAGSVAPEVQLCLQHLRPEERDRAARALGPLESVPLYRVQLEVEPKERRVWGKVQVELVAKGPKPVTELYLRLTPNTRSRQVALSGAKLNGKAVALELGPEPTLQRITVEPPVPPGGTVSLEVSLKGTVPKAAPGAESLLGSGGLLGG